MVIRPVVSLDEVAATPWKNGGGSTRTLALYPTDASLQDFVWRVSLAEVASSGPFSSFPGIARTIALWSGNGMVLEQCGRPAYRLDNPLDPYEFPGEVAVQATLLHGPTTDLNLMVRRHAAAATLLRCERETKLPRADDLLLVCRSGSFQIDLHDSEVRILAAEQMLHLSDLGHRVRLSPLQPGSTMLCAVVSVTHLRDTLS
jgi:environmental stress-induced protein Ves